MAFATKKSSFNRLILLVFGIAFGLVGLAFAYQGVKTSSDIRSRAAATNQIYKQWEFNGKDSEGWRAISPYTGTVRSGILVVSGPKASTLPAFRNTSVGTKLPSGLKSISFSMAVGQLKYPTPTASTCLPPPKCNGPVIQLMTARADGCPTYRCSDDAANVSTGFGESSRVSSPSVNSVQGVSDETDESAFKSAVVSRVACTMEARICPDGTAVGRSGSSCSFAACPGKGQRKFVGHLYYTLVGGKKYERPIQFTGLANSTFQTYTVNLPNSGVIEIESIRIVLTSGVKNGETVGVDWIRLLGPVPKPTPKPTCTPLPSCAYSTDRTKPICKLSAIAPNGGTWCPRPSPTIKPSPTIIQFPTATPTPTPLNHTLTVVSPNGGETLTIGQPYTIRWNTSSTFTRIDLQYVIDGGFSSFVAKNLSDTGNYTWSVNTLFGKGQYKIFIYGYTNDTMTANDSSDAYFTVAPAQ